MKVDEEKMLKIPQVKRVKGIFIPNNFVVIQAKDLEQFNLLLTAHKLSFDDVYERTNRTNYAQEHIYYAFTLSNGVPIVLKYVQRKRINLGETDVASSSFRNYHLYNIHSDTSRHTRTRKRRNE
ncbi:MAG: hypothetical protein J7J44_02530 [Deltaproteobacteria bacterium]|nr:hypothetical protein [Deltaproteobacteria bacterium]